MILLVLLWGCFNCRWLRGRGVGRKSYLGPAEIESFIIASAKTTEREGRIIKGMRTGDESIFPFVTAGGLKLTLRPLHAK